METVKSPCGDKNSSADHFTSFKTDPKAPHPLEGEDIGKFCEYYISSFIITCLVRELKIDMKGMAIISIVSNVCF